jgi:MSHA biogenesis protein MshO
MNRINHTTDAGFTLIEMIVAITILGILAAVLVVFLPAPINGYLSTSYRASLTDAADGAIRRFTREAATALPNSFRATTSGGSSCVEFIPTVAGGRYRTEVSQSGSGDILDFSQADTSFDALAQNGLSSLSGTNLVSIYNLGITGANAYAGDTTAQIQSVTIPTTYTANIKLSPGKQFPFASPGNQFFVIPNNSVTYSCYNGTLYRATEAISSSPQANCPQTGTVLVSNVSSCSLSYIPAIDQRNDALAISLQLTQNNETVTLYQEVLVSNVP